jgi:hypothetical protein
VTAPVASSVRQRCLDELVEVALVPKVAGQVDVETDDLLAVRRQLLHIQNRVVLLVVSLRVIVVPPHVDWDFDERTLCIAENGDSLDHAVLEQMQEAGIRDASRANGRHLLVCTKAAKLTRLPPKLLLFQDYLLGMDERRQKADRYRDIRSLICTPARPISCLPAAIAYLPSAAAEVVVACTHRQGGSKQVPREWWTICRLHLQPHPQSFRIGLSLHEKGQTAWAVH